MNKKYPLSFQLAAGMVLVVLVFVATLLAVATGVSRLKTGAAQVRDQSLPMVLAVDRLDLSRSEVQQFLTDVSATHDPAAYTEAQAATARFQAAAATVREILSRRGDTEALAQLAEIERRFGAFDASGRRMAAAYLKDGLEAGNRLMKGADGQPGFDQASSEVAELLAAFRDRQLALAQQDAEDNLRAAGLTAQAMLWGGLAATLVVAGVGWRVLQGVRAQIGGEPHVAARLMQRIGGGDLTVDIRLRPGDTTSLMAQLQRMVEGLRGVVNTVREQARGVTAASAEMAADHQALAERTTGQAGSLERTAASVAQLQAAVHQGVDGAHAVHALARAASTSAHQGGELVARVVDTMQGIEASSRQIADIVSLIDGIAFQTNILALNAAVEAARAGEQGRGFAVVASEVRSLAGRSAESAKAIAALIGSSVARIDEGAALVVRARTAMDEVEHNIRSVSQSMERVTAASDEQSAGIAVVAGAIEQMDELTRRNGEMVKAGAVAGAALSRQADALSASVAVFRL